MEEKKPVKTQPRKHGADRGEAIDLMDLLGFYFSRLPLLIAAVLIGAIGAGLITRFLIPDKFTATSRMYMVSASSDSVVNLTDLNIGTSLSSDYVELMQTRPIVENVIDELGLKYSYEEILRMISLSVVPNTRIVKISVTSTDPKEAMIIANQMAKTSRVELPKVMEAPTPTIAELAVLPTKRSVPPRITGFGATALSATAPAYWSVSYSSCLQPVRETAERQRAAMAAYFNTFFIISISSLYL